MTNNSEKAQLINLLSHVTNDAEEKASLLFKKYLSIGRIINTDAHSLAETLSGDMSTALYIRLVLAIVSRRFCDEFKFGKEHTEEEIEKYLAALFYGLSVETAYVMSFNASGKAVACDKINEGVINFSSILPRKIIEISKARKANSVIIAHNHPEGYAKASSDDITSTKLLKSILESADIRLISHYVVADSECVKIDL